MDIHDKLDKALDDLWCMEDALEALKDVEGLENVCDIIHDCMIVKGFEVNQLRAKIEEQDNKERDELVIEYIRSVI